MTRRTVLKMSAAFPLARYACAFQEQRKRISPHETVSVDVDGKTLTITYGRPYLKSRTVGKEVAPFGQVWRLGADEATKITVPMDAMIGSVKVGAGSYSLFAIPGEDKWTMIVNKTADQWGAFSYDQSKDIGRFDLPVQKPSSPVEEFTISLDKQPENTVKLTFAWGDQMVSTTLKPA